MDAVQNVNLNIRVNPNTKKEFEKFCDDVGMSMTTAVNLFIKKRFMSIGFRLKSDTKCPIRPHWMLFVRWMMK